MLNLKQAQKICNDIKWYYERTVKWNQVYNSEAEMIEDLKSIHIPTIQEESTFHCLYKGYKYIHAFAKQLQNGKALSDKQLIQCKRLALEIKKAAAIKNCYD